MKGLYSALIPISGGEWIGEARGEVEGKGEIEGMVWGVEMEEQFRRLESYKSPAYECCSYNFEIWDGERVRARTLCGQGIQKVMSRGRCFDLRK